MNAAPPLDVAGQSLALEHRIAMTVHPLLQLTDISKSFGAIRALRAAQLDLRAGEIHALMGENGAGKSTLMNIIDGILQPDGGESRIDGQIVRIDSPAAAQRGGIGFVHQ